MLDFSSEFMVTFGKEVGQYRSVRDLDVSLGVTQRSNAALHGREEFKV